MKSNRGVTISSLVIYVIGLVIMIGIMSTFTGYFYKNVNDVTIQQNAEEQYLNFLAYLTKDANSENLTFIQSGVNHQDCLILKFNTGEEHQYIYQNDHIFYLNTDEQNEKKITLCSDVSFVKTFEYADGKINLDLTIKDENFSTSLNVNIKN